MQTVRLEGLDLLLEDKELRKTIIEAKRLGLDPSSIIGREIARVKKG